MPRRRKKEALEAKEEGGGVEKKAKRRRKKSRKQLDLDKFAVQVFNDISEYLGLSLLKIPERVQREIVREVMNVIVTSTSYKPSIDKLFKRIDRNRELIYMIISGKILEHTPVSKLGDEQLEFIVYNGGYFIIEYIQDIYRELRRRGREDLISYLRYVWEKYGKPTPIECPKCGFRSIMPDYSCYICGYVVTGEYIRGKIGFEEKFKQYISTASVAELKNIIDAGYVLVGVNDVKSPMYRFKITGVYYPIYLKKRDIILVSAEISKRKIPV